MHERGGTKLRQAVLEAGRHQLRRLVASLDIALSHHPLKRQTRLIAGGELVLALFVIDEDADLICAAVA